jgi:penicillin-binding protein 2
MDYRERKELRDYLEERRFARRLILVRIGFALLFISCAAGFYWLQIVDGDYYRGQADGNRLRKVVIRPLRGNIYDRDGQPLAGNRSSFNIVLDREKLADPAPVVHMIAPILESGEPALMERIGRYKARPSYEPAILKEDVDLGEIAQFEARRDEAPQISITTDSRRDYIVGAPLAHVLGYVGEASEEQMAADPSLVLGDMVGKSGLEKVYDGALRGKRGEQLMEVNSVGRAIGRVHEADPPTPGQDLHLTLDMGMQKALVDSFGDEVGAGIFLDPRTGEVLAFASFPTFDPNAFTARFDPAALKAIFDDPSKPLQNRVISSKYSPGSTFKLLVATAALEEGIVDEHTSVYCGGGAVFYGRRFGCWKASGHGAINLHRALVESCNVWFYTIGQRLGIERIAKYADSMGFGAPSGIDLVGERAGTVPSPEWKLEKKGEPWYPGETISVAIGQGPMEVTALQMADMAACIANGGTIYKPVLVRPGAGQPVVPQEARRVTLSPHTLEVIRRAMWGVVNESGTGTRARVQGVEVVGKTGTVQVYKASAGVDSDKLDKKIRDHAWFVGYAPMEAPEVAFAVFVEHGGHGGTISAPIVRAVLEAHFNKGKPPVAAPPRRAPRPESLAPEEGTGAEEPLVAATSPAESPEASPDVSAADAATDEDPGR